MHEIEDCKLRYLHVSEKTRQKKILKFFCWRPELRNSSKVERYLVKHGLVEG